MKAATIFALGGIARLVLIAWGAFQDARMELKYTDIDYFVFSDGARFVAAGQSPFSRATYRYSPLLAWVLTPNVFLHEIWGKLMFSLFDLAIGFYIQRILVRMGLAAEAATRYSALWTLNPLAINISTRGSAEAIVCAIVLAVVERLLAKDVLTAAILYGVAVHLKIYPIIYALAFFLVLDGKNFEGLRAPRFFNDARLRFTLISASIFFLLTGVSYVLYGSAFLDEALLYHVTRRDTRHNFSVFFYLLYLGGALPETSSFIGIAAFLPQVVLVAAVSWYLYRDVPLCMFTLTFIFVTFNKVVTSQYFVWYICLLPLILPRTQLSLRWRGALLIAVWVVGQGLWLYTGYAVEFLGIAAFYPMWIAGVLFFAGNVYVGATIVAYHSLHSTFRAPRRR